MAFSASALVARAHPRGCSCRRRASQAMAPRPAAHSAAGPGSGTAVMLKVPLLNDARQSAGTAAS